MLLTDLMFADVVMPFLADAATAASASTDGTTGIVVGASSVSAITAAVVTYLKMRSTHRAAATVADAAKVPQPLVQEQTADQANWKRNEAAHTEIFRRLAAVEQKTASHDASLAAQGEMQRRMFDMITALYDRIIGGKKK